MNRRAMSRASGLWGAAALVLGLVHHATAQTSKLPTAVECSLYSRANRVVKRVAAGEEATMRLADLSLVVSFVSHEYEVPSVNLRASFSEKPLVSWLYQLPRNPPPQNQFVGDHGFTGLVHLTHPTRGGDYQLICKFAGI